MINAESITNIAENIDTTDMDSIIDSGLEMGVDALKNKLTDLMDSIKLPEPPTFKQILSIDLPGEEDWKDLVTAYPEDGTPTQENVDQSFKFLTDIIVYLYFVNYEVESYKNSSFKDKKEKLEKIIEEIETKIIPKVKEKQKEEVDENPIIKKIEEKIKIIEPLITAPGESIDKIAEYLESLAAYFLGPYKSLVRCIKFYTEYTTEMGKKITEILTLLYQTLQTLLDTLKTLILEAGEYVIMSITELEESKAGKAISEKMCSEIEIKRYEQ